MWQNFNKLTGILLPYYAFTAMEATVHHSFHSPLVGDVWASDSYHKAERHDIVQLEDESYCRVFSLLCVNFPKLGRQEIAVVQPLQIEEVPQFSQLGYVVVSELPQWTFYLAENILRPVVGLRHPLESSWYFLIRDKRDLCCWL
jgi:hypothetical protein